MKLPAPFFTNGPARGEKNGIVQLVFFTRGQARAVGPWALALTRRTASRGTAFASAEPEPFRPAMASVFSFNFDRWFIQVPLRPFRDPLAFIKWFEMAPCMTDFCDGAARTGSFRPNYVEIFKLWNWESISWSRCFTFSYIGWSKVKRSKCRSRNTPKNPSSNCNFDFF